jgi:amino acid transporter
MTAAAADIQEPLVRRLSVVGLWLLIINGMIGAGIFGVPAEAARLAGEFSPWVFAICGVLQLPTMLCFAQLGSYFTGTGGPVLYAGTAFGPIVGFQAGWCLYVARLLAFAANVNLLVNSLGYLLGGAIGPGLRVTLLFAVCSVLTLLNAVATRGAISWLSALTILKFVPLIAVVAFGLLKLHLSLPLQTPIARPDLAAAVLLVIYVYTGFESGLVVAGEARNPQRDLPHALLWALFVCSALYVLIQAVSVAALPALASSTSPLVDVAAALMGPWGALLLTAGVIASVGANLVGSMFSNPRITYRLALDGHLPHWFGTVHPTYKTPVWSIVFYGTACFSLAASGSFVWLAGLSVLTRVLLHLVCIGAMPRLKKRFGNTRGALRLPGGDMVPVLAAVVCVGLLTQMNALAYVSAGAFLAVGGVLYVAAHRSSRDARYSGRRNDAAIEGSAPPLSTRPPE